VSYLLFVSHSKKLNSLFDLLIIIIRPPKE